VLGGVVLGSLRRERSDRSKLPKTMTLKHVLDTVYLFLL